MRTNQSGGKSNSKHAPFSSSISYYVIQRRESWTISSHKKRQACLLRQSRATTARISRPQASRDSAKVIATAAPRLWPQRLNFQGRPSANEPLHQKPHTRAGSQKLLYWPKALAGKGELLRQPKGLASHASGALYGDHRGPVERELGAAGISGRSGARTWHSGRKPTEEPAQE